MRKVKLNIFSGEVNMIIRGDNIMKELMTMILIILVTKQQSALLKRGKMVMSKSKC